MATSDDLCRALLQAKQKNTTEEAKLYRTLNSLERQRMKVQRNLVNGIFQQRQLALTKRQGAARARRFELSRDQQREDGARRRRCSLLDDRRRSRRHAKRGLPRTLSPMADGRTAQHAARTEAALLTASDGRERASVVTLADDNFQQGVCVLDERPAGAEASASKLMRHSTSRSTALPPIDKRGQVSTEYITFHEKAVLRLQQSELSRKAPTNAPNRKHVAPLPMIAENIGSANSNKPTAEDDAENVSFDTNGQLESVPTVLKTSPMTDSRDEEKPNKPTDSREEIQATSGTDSEEAQQATHAASENRLDGDKRELRLPRFMLGNQTLPLRAKLRQRDRVGLSNPLPPINEDFSRIATPPSTSNFWLGDPQAIRSVRRNRIPADEISHHRWDRIVETNKFILNELKKNCHQRNTLGL